MNTIRRCIGIAVAVVALFLAINVHDVDAGEPFIVIVNTANPVKDISLEDLQNIFKAEKQNWEAGKISLGVQSGAEYDTFTVCLLKMDAAKIKKIWLKKVFQGEASSPKTLAGAAEALAFVKNDKNAMTFIRKKDLSGDVRALTIGGKSPASEGYPLQ